MPAWAYTAGTVLCLWLAAAFMGALIFKRVNARDPAYSEAGLRGLALRLWIALLVLEPVLLFMWTANVSGASTAKVLAMLPQIVSMTHFGHALLVRWLALAALGVAFLRRRNALIRGWIALCLVLFAWSHSVVGHAGENSDYGWPVWVDSLHYLATTTWAGLLFTGARAPLADAHAAYARAIQHLSVIAAILLALVVATGLVNAGHLLQGPSDLLHSGYGWMLDMKLAAVVLAIILAATNRYLLLPRLALACNIPFHRGPLRDWMRARFVENRPAPTADGARRALRLSIAVEAFALFAALLLAGLLRQSMPPMPGG